MKILWHGGVTRTVILTKRYAIKLPCLVYGWKFFLYGFLANMQERAWAGSDERLCPIRYADPLGFFVVMPRCEPLTDTEFIREVAEDWPRIIDDETDQHFVRELPVEMKTCSFGRLYGKIVAVDYGGCGRDGRTTQMCESARRSMEEEAGVYRGYTEAEWGQIILDNEQMVRSL